MRRMHYTACDEQMYLFLYVEEWPRHVRHSSAWASGYCPWLQGFYLKNALNSGHSSIYKCLPCNEPIPLPSCSRKLCSQKRRGLSAQSDSIEWHSCPLSKPSIGMLKIDLHTSLSVTAFHSAQERSRAPKLLTPTIISIVQLATFQNQDHLKNKRPTTIQTYLFKKSWTYHILT
jgi:hypothetical protein